MTIKTKENKNGFTLIEVIIATAIFALVIGAAVMAENQNVKAGTISKHRLQAAGLGQEAFTMVTRIRDLNALGQVVGGNCTNINQISSCPAGVYVLNSNGTLTRTSCAISNYETCEDNRFNVDLNDGQGNKTYIRKIIIE